MRLLAFKESDNSCQKTTVGAYIVVWIAANMISCNKYGMFVNLIIKSSIRTDGRRNMKRKIGCIFMSMILFFGVAVMGVDAAGKKQGFTPKTIAVKKSYTSSTEKYLNEKKTY